MREGETALIKLIDSLLPVGKDRLNRCFECDSEIIDWGGKKLLFTMDEFSAEDRLREHDPYSLGWNVAVGSVSDILATGGTPTLFAHGLTVGRAWTRN
jgi:thiamine-monophosphate kinase